MANNRTKGAAVGGALIALVGSAEGLRQNAYPDPGTHGKPWTICYGHTGDVRPGDKMTTPQCKDLMLKDLEIYADKVQECTKKEITDEQFVAFVDFSFNLGSARYCKSIAPLVNEGRIKEACNKLLEFNRAAGFVMPGLTKRRERERSFCLHGV